MGRAYNQHQQRHQGLSAFGKDLTRRSAACCELCEARGVKLQIHEVPPIPTDPELEHCIFVCETCLDQLQHPKKRDPDHWRCLTRAIWSQVPAVQVTAVWMARQLSAQPWVAEMLEQLYLDPDIDAWVEKSDP
ncbi:MAG: phnA protein [Motiliproteus sp.]